MAYISELAPIFVCKKRMEQALALLEQLIETPSFSKEEGATADLIEAFLARQGLAPQRSGHNVWTRSTHWKPERPTLLLNSHHDTVRPAAGWQRGPFSPSWEGDRLYGLGSNDAGGPLVCLIAAFVALAHNPDLGCNLVLAATAEEEISGPGGVASILSELGPISCGIVGEPTCLNMAIAERGLVVIDAEAVGQSGHAAREEGINALYLALDDIQRLRQYQFPKVSPMLGPVKISVTQIEAGTQHNVVPDRCRFVLDVRVNEYYRNEEVVACLQAISGANLRARSLRLQSSYISTDHPLVRSGLTLGLPTYGSPTLSDQALLPFDTLKLGPGDSARSHTADEYICRSELMAGYEVYLQLITQYGRLCA